MLFIQARILLHVALRNRVAVAAHGALITFLTGAATFYAAATIYNVQHGTGFGSVVVSTLVGIALVSLLLLGATAQFCIVGLAAARRVLRPNADQLWAMPVELFEAELAERQPVLF